MSNEVSVKVDKELHTKIKQVADVEGRKLQRVVADALRYWLDARQQHRYAMPDDGRKVLSKQKRLRAGSHTRRT